MSMVRVARRARVSTATVSRVVNDSGPVKPSTRARVLEAIEACNYSPNLHARSLAGGQSRSIGVIVSSIDNPFFLDVYRAIETRAHDAGYDVIMAHTDHTPERLVTSVRLMLGRRVAGLAAMVSEMDPKLMAELGAERIPVVFYDVGSRRRDITSIRVDYETGMDKLMSYLYGLGHRHLGILTHHVSLAPVNERQKAVLGAVRRYPKLRVATAVNADTLEGGRRAARALLDGNPRLTAIVCVNDLMAVGALWELRRSGRRVPDDVSVTGFDNIALAQFCHPALTTVHIPRDTIGRVICDFLTNRDEAARFREFVIDPELVVRESTGPAPSSAER
jgi:LacI family transcriptional regulator, galactose operon repressor